MINASPTLHRFEARYARETGRTDSFDRALQRFAALWVHAQTLNPELGADWAEDLAADRAIARAVNGLPPVS
ncbi:MAG: hypothetical protein ACT4PM_04165 [Gemmatimonadales bacterium]